MSYGGVLYKDHYKITAFTSGECCTIQFKPCILYKLKSTPCSRGKAKEGGTVCGRELSAGIATQQARNRCEEPQRGGIEKGPFWKRKNRRSDQQGPASLMAFLTLYELYGQGDPTIGNIKLTRAWEGEFWCLICYLRESTTGRRDNHFYLHTPHQFSTCCCTYLLYSFIFQ